MVVKRKYADKAEIPEKLRELYEEKDGDWVLSLDDDAPADMKGRLEEFRRNNVLLAKQRDELEAKLKQFGDVDADTVRRAMESLNKQQDEQIGGLLKKGEFDKVLELQKSKLEQSHKAQMAALQRERDEFKQKAGTLSGRFGDILLAQKLDEALAAKKLRLQPSAKDDLVARAKRVFRPTADVDDIAAADDATDLKGKPWTTQSWLDAQVATAGHLFEGGGGGGAGKGGGSLGGKTLYNRDDYVRDPAGFTRVADEIRAGKAAWAE